MMYAQERDGYLYIGVALPAGDSGGWGAVLVVDGKRHEYCGVDLITSTDRLGLHAIIAGLGATEQAMPLHIVTDNQRLHGGLTEYLPVWERNGWLARNGQGIRHRDLWQQVLVYTKTRAISSSLRGEPGDAMLIAQAKRLANKAAQARARKVG